MSGVLAGLIGSFAPVSTAFESIATATGNGSSSAIDFTNIPSTYKHLQLRIIARDTTASDLVRQFNIRVGNGSIDTASNYAWHYLTGAGPTAGVAAGGNSALSYIAILNGQTGGGATANTMGAAIIDLVDYASTSKTKTIRYIAGGNTNTADVEGVSIGSGLWNSTSAINAIRVYYNNPFTTTTQVALYGIKG